MSLIFEGGEFWFCLINTDGVFFSSAVTGLDHDNDPKGQFRLHLQNSELLKRFRLKLCVCVSESTVIAEQSTIVADSTLTGSDGTCPKHPVQTFSRVYCKDCEPVSTYCSSTKYTSPSLRCPGPSEHEESETPTIYCRERSRTSRTGEATGR